MIEPEKILKGAGFTRNRAKVPVWRFHRRDPFDWSVIEDGLKVTLTDLGSHWRAQCLPCEITETGSSPRVAVAALRERLLGEGLVMECGESLEALDALRRAESILRFRARTASKKAVTSSLLRPKIWALSTPQNPA